MEGGKSGKSQSVGRSSVNRDLYAAVRDGTVRDVESALASLKKSNASVDARDRFGSSALHVASWRNHVPVVKRLLSAGADPDARDGESGWGSLHRALHFGHLAVAGALIDGGASMHLEDARGRIPVDLVSGPLKQAATTTTSSNGVLTKEMFSWGNGSNYQLGTGTAGIQRVPCRVDVLHGVDIVAISAAKFHSVVVTSKGEVYSWGYGRGGRLGHEDYSGEVAVITPRRVTNVLGGRRVRTVAAAKHHTIVATLNGEVYTWGTNREGQLGYPSVDTQSTPRRVSSLRGRIIAVAAANKHSAAVSETGEVYTWGCNREGQLGYGISNSASNCVPRVVEYLREKHAVAVAAAKYHTIALVDGEVFSWGHRMVSPRRVLLTRNTKKGGASPLKFHQSERLQIVAIAAGVVYSTVISEEGLVFSWLSADSQLHAQQVLPLTGHRVVSVSAGKFRTAVVTSTGDVYAWDSEPSSGNIATRIPQRIHGIKRVSFLAVGETHSLAVTELYVPVYSQATSISDSPSVQHAPSLRDMCQKVLAESVLEPKNAVQLLEYADSLGADELKHHCETLILHNLDYILTFYPASFGTVRSSVLADLEKAWDSCSSQPWSHRHLPVPSATIPATVDSEEDENEFSVNRRILKGLSTVPAMSGFLEDDSSVSRHTRAIRKKLQQIKALEVRLFKGQILDEQQLTKISTKSSLVELLKEHGETFEDSTVPQHTSCVDVDEACLKRQRRKTKKRTDQTDIVSPACTAVPQQVDAEVRALTDVKEMKEVREVKDFKAVDSTNLKEEPNVKEAGKSRRKCKKGGLSMFLAGGLDDKPKTVPVPVAAPPVQLVKAKDAGPAWGGGALKRVETASLSDIQSQQKAESLKAAMKQTLNSGSSSSSSNLTPQGILLQDFVRTPPWQIPTSPAKAAPWLGTSPGSVASLKDIQIQEVRHKEQRQHQKALNSRQPVVGFATSPDSGERPPSCWFKPDSASPSSIRCIQIEEKAMQDLRRLYKNVKMVNLNS